MSRKTSRLDLPTDGKSSHDRAKLSRQQTMRPSSRQADRPSLLADPSKLTRMATYHHAPTSGPSTKSTGRKPAVRTPKASSSKHDASAARRPARPEPPSGTDAERERRDRKRRQNTESARRMRELRRKEVEQLEKAYDANEVRITELELVAEELSRELRRHNTISDTPRSGSSRSGSGTAAFEVPEDRPGWFGAPFWWTARLGVASSPMVAAHNVYL